MVFIFSYFFSFFQDYAIKAEIIWSYYRKKKKKKKKKKKEEEEEEEEGEESLARLARDRQRRYRS